jgi:hypothetical protein
MKHQPDDRRWFAAFFFLLIATLATARAVQADVPTIVLHYVPIGVGVVVTPDVAPLLSPSLHLDAPTLYRMYTVSEFIDIARLDIAYFHLSKDHALLEDEAKILEELNTVHEARIASLEGDLTKAMVASDRLYEKWKVTDKERALAVAKASPIWPWIVLAGGGILAVVGGTVLLTSTLVNR